jgi:acetyl esterase/lipase
MTTEPTVDHRQVGPPPSFDPEMVEALALVNRLLPPTVTAEMVPKIRGFLHKLQTPEDQLRRDGAFDVTWRQVPGAPGAPEVPLLVCLPTGVEAPTGAIYFMHGGGMVIGDHQGNDLPPMLDIAQELGLAVVSVQYRLAPEHPYPAAVEDTYAGLVWTALHAAELNVDPARIVIAGISAGGGLAASSTLLAGEFGGPALAGQMLIGPMLDDRNDSKSGWQMQGLGIWDRESNTMGWSALLGDRYGSEVPPYASPARQEDLSGLPPTFLDVGSAETFRDEVLDFADRLWQAGVDAELHVWPGAFHGFYLMAPQAEVSRKAIDQWRQWLQHTLGQPSTDAPTD